MPNSFRNNFTSGVLDPKLHARADLPQWRTGLKTGKNVILLPHGGARRRPGMKFFDIVDEPGRIARFRFNREQQYLLHFQDGQVDIYTSSVGRITSVATPYATAELPDLYLKAQTADTMVVFHEDHAPHRLLRGVLDSSGPIRTLGGTELIRIVQDAHDLVNGDFVGLSGLTDVGGVDADQYLNKSHEVFAVEGTVSDVRALQWKRAKVVELDIDYGSNNTDYGFRVGDSITIKGAGALNQIPAAQINRTQTITAIKARIQFEAPINAVSSTGLYVGAGGSAVTWKKSGDPTAITLSPNPLYMTAGSKTVKVEIDAADYPNLQVGDSIVISGVTGTPGGIAASNFNGTRTVTAVHGGIGTRLQFAVESDGAAGGQNSTSVSWKAANFVEAYTGHNASSTAIGGGSAGRVWAFTSLAPSEDRKVALDNLPQFNFEDADSPPPKAERQIAEFQDFVAGDDYQLVISLPQNAYPGANKAGPQVVRTPELLWSTAYPNNAAIMQKAINDVTYTTDLVKVTYEGVTGGVYKYSFQFSEPVPIDLIQVNKVHSSAGIITVTREVEGGSRDEDVISDTRGWPSGGIFFQRRLWMFGIKSRPSTLLASQSEDFFNFEVGSALDSEAIDVTGEFDPIVHLIAERELTMLTSGSEVTVSGGGDGAAITPGNINLQVASRYGATAVPPVSIGGRPMYVDSVGRNVRQFGASPDSPTGSSESSEISILSQHLIKTPVGMELWRNADGDYVFVVNDDGTCAVLNINQSQGVAGWTELTTDGDILELAEVDGGLFATVQRTVDGDDYVFLEKFDYDRHTDACVRLELGSSSTMTNLDHLATATVQVRADDMTMEPQVVSGGGEVSVLSGDVPIPSDVVEAGLAIPEPKLEPMPPQVSQFSAISKASVDVYESRGIRVNGYKLRDVSPGQEIDGATPLVTGIRGIQVRGYGDRQTIAITMPEPQPAHIRAIEMEVVA